MNINPINSISPIDGRYYLQTRNLTEYFSEKALMRYRLWVEVEYFIALCEIPLPQLLTINKTKFVNLRAIYTDFNAKNAVVIKGIERTTNHDVKAIEYYLRDQFDLLGLGAFKEFIHFGLTSQDINNTAIPFSYKAYLTNDYFPLLFSFLDKLVTKIEEYKDVPMLAHTHGQAATPTRLGKELMVFEERLMTQINMHAQIEFGAKFGGATGNFNAHHISFPNMDWKNFADEFIKEQFGLKRQQNTTQIEHYDNMAASFDNLKRINTILIDLCRDIWAYISLGYFGQATKEGEVGSSAMPHKVNPIDFENAEGNLGYANAIFTHLSEKLPISRLQRDLTDSTVLRNIGVPLSHSVIAFNSLLKGLDKLILNEQKIHQDLENNWAIVAEAIQTILRRENYHNPYEALRQLTRGNANITKERIQEFIDELHVKPEVKEELKRITPQNYIGI